MSEDGLSAGIVASEVAPCQIVTAVPEKRLTVIDASSGPSTRLSQMAVYGAALADKEWHAAYLAEVCARADVELLRCPVPPYEQKPGQTVAIGAVAICLKRYGEDTLITALQCVTETVNNLPGALTADIIKALCKVLHQNPTWRDSGLALLELFDRIDLAAIEQASMLDAEIRKVERTQTMADFIRSDLARLWLQCR